MVAVALVATACQGGGNAYGRLLKLHPQSQFVLRTARGNPLPVVELSDEWRTLQLLADTIMLRDDGSGTRRTSYLSHEAAARVDSSVTLIVPVSYKVDGDKIRVGLGCPAGMACAFDYVVPYISGRLTRTGIRFDRGVGTGAYNVVPLVYDQQP